MNWYTIFYLFSILDKLSTALGWIAGLSTLGFIIFTVVYFINKQRLSMSRYEDDGKHWLNVIKWPYRTTIIFLILSWVSIIFVPTRRDMLIIIAGGAVGEFITTDSSARQLPADITRFLRGEILSATAELGDEAKASLGIKTEAEKQVEKIKSMSREELEKLLLEKTEKK